MEKKPEYHVQCGIYGIYAGTLSADGQRWKRKSTVTDEAIMAVRDYFLSELMWNVGQVSKEWDFRGSGRKVTLTLKVETEKHDEKGAEGC